LWHTSIIPALWRLKQEYHDKPGLHRETLSPKKTKKKRKENKERKEGRGKERVKEEGR
jgi:hypothetical protein